MVETDPSVRDTDKLVKTAKAPSTTVKDVESALFTKFGIKRGGDEH